MKGMKRLAVLGLFAAMFGCCELEQEETELGNTSQAALAGDSFTFRVSERKEMVGKILERWERATCMRFEMRDDGTHSISFPETGYGKGRIGQTTGTWQAANIIVKPWDDWHMSVVLTHELAHLLALTNEHQPDSVMSADDGFEPGNQAITAALLARVCSVRDCGCFAPER